MLASAYVPVSLWTDAGVSVHSVDAVTSMLALVLLTVVKVQLTMLTYITRSALTPLGYKYTHRLSNLPMNSLLNLSRKKTHQLPADPQSLTVHI